MKNRAIVFLLSIMLLISFCTSSKTSAMLGPVHVELNTTQEKFGAARANSVTAFVIYFRINVNIEVHDWVKVWFPTNEASWDEEDICDGLPEIRGVGLEHPRFIPNEKYFEKYDNPEEEKIGKLYEILDEHNSTTKFYEPESCDKLSEDCRLRPDPSGLGYWLMGTVMPSLPKDKSDRKERTAQIIHQTHIGYEPCTECQGYPFMTQTEKECSFMKNSAVGVEAWRQGYNPIDYTFSKATGIIAPATPGRYRLKIATAGEPEPVESDSFVLPCSRISNTNIKRNSPSSWNKSALDIGFDVGEGGALDAGNSMIHIQFPDEFELPEKLDRRYIYINDVQLMKLRNVDTETNTISLVCPANIENTGHVKISFLDILDLQFPKEKKNYVFKISTSSEPEEVEGYFDNISEGEKFWEQIPTNVKKRILKNEELDESLVFESIDNNNDLEKLVGSLQFVSWGVRPEVSRDYSRLFFNFYVPYEKEYLLAYHKTGGQAPTAFLGPDCCHYEPGFSADDPFDPRKPVIYPGFGTIYPYCDVMIKSYRRCSHKTSKTIQPGKDYLMIIIGGDQCASVGCKSFREEHDTFFTFIPSVEFESDYTKTFSRFSEIYPLEFKPMLPNECWHYTNEPGSIFLFEHDWNNKTFKLSVGKTPGDFEMFFDLDLSLTEWNTWLDYVYHMKKLGR